MADRLTAKNKKKAQILKPRKWPKSKTVQGDAIQMDKIITAYKAGHYSSALENQHFDVELHDITEDQFDLPDIQKFQLMDPIEQLQVRSNLQALQNTINAKAETTKKQYEAHQKKIIENQQLAQEMEAFRKQKEEEAKAPPSEPQV